MFDNWGENDISAKILFKGGEYPDPWVVILRWMCYITGMTEHILKSHNKTLLLYHLVFPVKYRKEIFSDEVTESLKDICLGISRCYEIHFVEIGSDDDHVHFLVQSVPALSVSRIVAIIKSITAREIFSRHKEVKKVLWGGNL